MTTLLLAINPGSTTTKIAVFAADGRRFSESIRHPAAELTRFPNIMAQKEYRRDHILETLNAQGFSVAQLKAIIGRGGLMRPLAGGIYRICADMLADLRTCRYGAHASNLGAILAHDLAAPAGLPSYIADPVVVDELAPLARYSGHPDIRRRSIFHALNHKAVARRAARTVGKSYEQLRLIVAHLGGGVSVGAHEYGRVVDVNNALDGDGPFSAERSGGLPTGQVMDWCFAADTNEQELRKRLTGSGGLRAYLGTANGQQIEARIKAGDSQAREVHAAMAYQIAKEIGAMSAVLHGKVDAVILTGGLAHDTLLVESIRARIAFLGRVLVYAGEDEMQALAEAAFRALRGEEPVRSYSDA